MWYSAAWSVEARGSFRAAVRAACGHPIATSSPHTAQLLRRWLVSSVTLKAARAGWLALPHRAGSDAANFLQSADQLAYCDYRLTGQLLDASVGSVVMFDTPPRGELQRLSVFGTIPQATLLAERRTGARDISEAAVRVARRRVEALRSALRADELVVEVRCWLQSQMYHVQQCTQLAPICTTQT